LNIGIYEDENSEHDDMFDLPSPTSFRKLTINRSPVVAPINLILFLLFIFVVYMKLRPTTPITIPNRKPTVFRTFTPRTLLPFNGIGGTPVYLAVNGRVFDVSAGRNFYGPGGPYANFAGRDASRGLACGSFDEAMLTSDLDGPLDTLQGLGAEEMGALGGWEERFQEKYLVVGKLVPVGSPEAETSGR
jgi:membrane-associated progesterone receptor component